MIKKNAKQAPAADDAKHQRTITNSYILSPRAKKKIAAGLREQLQRLEASENLSPRIDGQEKREARPAMTKKNDVDGFSQQVDVVAERTAVAILQSLNRMRRDLPEGAAPQMMIEQVVRELARQAKQPNDWLLQLIMEDQYVREAYYSEIAKRPLSKAKKRG